MPIRSRCYFKNPLATVIVNSIGLEDNESELEKKYKNYDLPENFTEKELKELDEFVKQREI